MNKTFKKIIIDFDNTLVKSTQCICDLYNEDFKYFYDFKPCYEKDILTYDFKELTLAQQYEGYIDSLWTQPRFFERLQIFKGALDFINLLKNNNYIIEIATLGTYANCCGKRKYIEKNFPMIDTLYLIDLTNQNKSMINMKHSLFIDDNEYMLNTSNALTKVCFGVQKPWNKNFSGIRIPDWESAIKMIM